MVQSEKKFLPGMMVRMNDDDRKKRPQFKLEDNADELFRDAFENASLRPKETDRTDPGSDAKKKQAKAVRVDLHGLTESQAFARIDDVVAQLQTSSTGSIAVTFITGRGLHSPQGKGVLGRSAHSYVQSRYAKYIQHIDDSPADVLIGGKPIRGHFTAKFRF